MNLSDTEHCDQQPLMLDLSLCLFFWAWSVVDDQQKDGCRAAYQCEQPAGGTERCPRDSGQIGLCCGERLLTNGLACFMLDQQGFSVNFTRSRSLFYFSGFVR